MKTIFLTHKDKSGNVVKTPYVTVSERVKALRNKHGFDLSIKTDIHTLNEEFVIFKASLFNGETLISTGFAKESKSDGFINKGSHIENCETSAVGRCLAFAGFGIDAEIASADEVLNADKNLMISDNQKQIIENMLHDSSLDEVIKDRIEKEMFEMSYSRANDCIEYLGNNLKEPENLSQKAIQKKLDEKLSDEKA